MARQPNSKCLHCRSEFYAFPANKKVGKGKYCGRQCFVASLQPEPNSKCHHCYKEFYVIPAKITEGKGKYCSRACHDNARYPDRERCECLHCGKEFSVAPARKKNGRGSYCSKQCLNIALSQDFPEPAQQMVDRFWSNVTKSEGCWIYGNARSQCHKVFHRRPIDGGVIGAHVFSFELHHGPLPEGQLVRHTCDVGACIRPEHLIPGSHKQNSQDMVERDRAFLAKLQLKDVIEIRRRYNSGDSISQLAKEYEMSYAGMWQVVHRQTWAMI